MATHRLTTTLGHVEPMFQAAPRDVEAIGFPSAAFSRQMIPPNGTQTVQPLLPHQRMRIVTSSEPVRSQLMHSVHRIPRSAQSCAEHVDD